MTEQLVILDTTLRDGAQTPGIGMNAGEKLRIALQLEKLGVDIMEIGFPASSKAEFDAVREIAGTIENTAIAVLARATESDIERAWEAVKHAARPVLHTFISSSDIHMKHKLNMSRDEVIATSVKATRLAKSYTDSVQFAFEDGSRTDPDFLCLLCQEVIKAGAQCVNIADTVGYATPDEFATLIRYVMTNTPNIGDAKLSVHCHDDLGLATANTLAAIRAGARQIDVTINGIGERAGNTPLEEIVAVLRIKNDSLGVSTNIVTEEIYATSRLVSSTTGVKVQPNKAVVGDNAFSHESGIHQDGMLKSPLTYQILTPEAFGIGKAKLVLGNQSGKHGLKARLSTLGWKLTGEELDSLFKLFKDTASQKREVSDNDLEALVASYMFRTDDIYQLGSYSTEVKEEESFTARVMIKKCEHSMIGNGRGNSAVQAIFDAIRNTLAMTCDLVNFSVNALSDGFDARGEAIVRIMHEDQMVLGRATDRDMLTACAKAYIDGANRIEFLRTHPILRTGQKWDTRISRESAPREAVQI